MLIEISARLEFALEDLAASMTVVEPLKQAFAYGLFPKGKRIRPLFALGMAADCGLEIAERVRPALALELIHASSLIHDDLPALDNDDIRRGKPTCHKAFGEATAILAGDLLISEAFACLSASSLTASQACSLVKILSDAFRDVCHGQQRDVLSGEQRGSLELLHRLKTGALFRAAAQFGAVFANLDVTLIDEAGKLGERVGVLFQIIDDSLDIIDQDSAKGRPTGSDLRNQRQTFGSADKRAELSERTAIALDQTKNGWRMFEVKLGRELPITKEIFNQVVSSIPIPIDN